MGRITWNDLLVGLALVRIGQELGHNTALARAVYEITSTLGSFFGRIS